MNILKALFGGSKNAETLVGGAVKGLDAIVFTKEERSQASQKLSDWYLKYLDATQPQNMARRFIAVIVTLLWGLFTIVASAVYWISPAYSEFLFGVLTQVILDPFLVVIGFYFLTHTVRAFVKDKKK